MDVRPCGSLEPASAVMARAGSLYAEGFRLMVSRDFAGALSCFSSLYGLLQPLRPSARAFVLLLETLLKVAECQLALGRLDAAAAMCSYLAAKEARLGKPRLRHRLHLIRGLSRAGRGAWALARADLMVASATCPPDKRGTMDRVLQQLEHQLRLWRGARGPDSATELSSASCASVQSVGGGGMMLEDDAGTAHGSRASDASHATRKRSAVDMLGAA